MSAWVVCKFGGTSVSTLENWQQIVKILRSHASQKRRVLVVCSALSGISNHLEQLLNNIAQLDVAAEVTKIHQRYLDFAQSLGLTDEALLQEECAQLQQLLTGIVLVGEVTPRLHARVLAFGELWLTKLAEQYLLAQSLDVKKMDAVDLLKVSAKAKRHYRHAKCDIEPDSDLAATLAAAPQQIVLTQGFIAGNEQGETLLLGRGGSDISAAYFAAKLSATACEIWTDVPGIYTANPHQIPQARLLMALNYKEAQEIASMGAKVLHPNCIEPVKQQNIPLMIKYTAKPEVEGTTITLEGMEARLPIKAVISKLNVILISLETVSMWQRVGFLAQVFACFAKFGLSIDLISTSETNITVSLDTSHPVAQDVLQELLEELNLFSKAKIIAPCASISLIGRNIRQVMHQLGPALGVFESQQIHLISQAANDLNLTFVVAEEQVSRLTKKLHNLLIEENPNHHFLGRSWQADFGEPLVKQPKWWEQRAPELLQMAAENSPAYVYSVKSLQSAVDELKSCHSLDRIFYAMKANPNADILRLFDENGLGFECVSLAEVNFILELFPEIERSRILFTPNFAEKIEYEQALALGVNVTIDNLYPLQHWPELFAQKDILLRIDPGYGAGHHKYVTTGGSDAKFGITTEQLATVAQLAEQHDIRIVGLHTHSGSGILQADMWQRTALQLTQYLNQFPNVRFLNIGGGLGVVEKPAQQALDMQKFDQALAKIKKAYPQLEIWLEPGRFLVARAGVLLTTVTQTKSKGPTHFVGVNTGMNSLIRPALYGSYHEIVNLTRLKDEAAQVAHVVGPICESGDVLGYSRLLPKTQAGDVILIANVGAYGHSMSSYYNFRQPAAESFLR